MLMTVTELKEYIQTDLADGVLAAKLSALELLIKKYTNNDFKDGFPIDVKLGAVKLLEWDLKNGDKLGIASETISRHSVSYVDLNENSVAGYPKALMDFLKLYRKARF